MIPELTAAAIGATSALRWDSLGLDPIALDLGFFQLRWYSLAYLAGIAVGWWYLLKLISQPGAPLARRHADDLVFYATLGVLQDFAIAAEAQTPKLLSTDNTRKVVNFVGSAAKTIDAVPAGWKPTVMAGLVQLQADLPPPDWARVAPYVQLIKVLIAEVP